MVNTEILGGVESSSVLEQFGNVLPQLVQPDTTVGKMLQQARCFYIPPKSSLDGSLMLASYPNYANPDSDKGECVYNPNFYVSLSREYWRDRHLSFHMVMDDLVSTSLMVTWVGGKVSEEPAGLQVELLKQLTCAYMPESETFLMRSSGDGLWEHSFRLPAQGSLNAGELPTAEELYSDYRIAMVKTTPGMIDFKIIGEAGKRARLRLPTEITALNLP